MFSVLFKLKWFFKDHWKRYTVAVSLLIIASAFEVLPPWLVGGAIDSITMGEMTTESLMQYVFYFVGIIIIGYVLELRLAISIIWWFDYD